MVCVLGERWCVLITMTVMMIEAMTKIIVNSMYFPMRGTALEVEGMSSTITSKNTVRDNRTEILRVIFSPKNTEHKSFAVFNELFLPLVLACQIEKHSYAGQHIFQLSWPLL